MIGVEIWSSRRGDQLVVVDRGWWESPVAWFAKQCSRFRLTYRLYVWCIELIEQRVIHLYSVRVPNSCVAAQAIWGLDCLHEPPCEEDDPGSIVILGREG